MRTQPMAAAACAFVAVLALGGRITGAQQQHSYTAEEVAEGGKRG